MKLIEFEKLRLTEKFVVAQCVEELKKEGRVVMLPWGGSYVVAGGWLDSKARDGIYRVRKSRMFQLFHWDFEDCLKHGIRFSKPARKLATRLCPAPLTIIDNEDGGDEIAFQIPPGPSMVHDILEGYGLPVAVSGTGKNNGRDALSSLFSQPDLAVDMGTVNDPVVSTVVELKNSQFKILRQGSIKENAIRDALA